MLPEPARWVLTAIAVSPVLLGGSVAQQIELVDVTAESGITFRHHHGGTGRKHMPESLGSGVVWHDYDVDGHWDLYFVDSGPLPGAGRGTGPVDEQGRVAGANAVYRNAGDGRYRLVTTGAEDPAYGLGATVGDYDADGLPDLLVTNFGPERLYRNNGDGTFSGATTASGVGGEGLSASAAWGDVDNDGNLDLFVTDYVEYELDNAPQCREPVRGLRAYCHPRLLPGQVDHLYRNRGDGTFERLELEPMVANRFEGKGLGVVMGDLDDDGRVDVYVANDSTRNFLYMNRGGFRVEDVSLFAGVGYSETGQGQAGMGVDLGDVDGDGSLEIVVTNFSFESNNLYRSVGPSAYVDDTHSLGLGDPSLAVLGFGVVISDLDGDGDLDLGVANGHVLDTVTEALDGTTYEQPNQIFVNQLRELRESAVAGGELAPPGDPSVARQPQAGWRPRERLFVEVSREVGNAITRRRVSRGLAAGDGDGDGWPDLAVTNSNGPAELLRNVTRPDHRRLALRFRGREANRDAYGARVRVTPDGDYPQVHEVRSASSYLSQNASDLYIGLGAADAARVEVRWPGGQWERVGRIGAGQVALIVEGRGVVATRPFEPRRELAGGSRPLHPFP